MTDKQKLSLTCLTIFALTFFFNSFASAGNSASTANGLESFGPEGQIIPVSNLGKSALGLRVTTVAKKPLPRTVETTGKIEAIPTWQFEQHSLVSGRIINLLVKQGQHVIAKQPLLLLDSPEINELASEALKQKTELEYQIAQTKAELDAEIKQNQTQFDLAQIEVKRNEKLFAEGIAAQRTWQQATTESKLAESRLKAATEKRDIVLRALKARLNIIYDSLSHRLGQLGVSDSRLKEMFISRRTILTVPVLASREGMVAQVSASVGQSVDTTDELFKISNLSKVWATADIYEDDVSRMTTGQSVSLSVASYPHETFYGTLTYIGTEMDPEKRTLPVRAEIANADQRLKPDMYAQLHIQTSAPVQTIMLPKEALVDSTGHTLVFVETKEGYQPTRVKTGRSLGDQIEVLAGVTEGQRVIVEGAFQLAAELLKSGGREELFAQPTEGERLIGHDGESDSANDGQAWHVQLVAIAVIISFLLGLLVSKLSKRSIRENQQLQARPSDSSNDSEKIAKG